MRDRRLLVLLTLAVVAAALAVAHAAGRGAGGTVVGHVSQQVGNGKPTPVAGAVVYLMGVKVAPSKARGHQTIQQKDLKFTPAFTVIMKGDTIDFPNNETNAVDHNVFSPHDVGTTWFNLGRYGRGVSKHWKFNRVGDYEIFCDIHPDMRAQVKVVDNEYYVYTDAEGDFRIADVPPGTYEIRVWRPSSVERTGTVTVKVGAASAPVQLVFTSAASSGPRRHMRLDGSAYPEYRGSR